MILPKEREIRAVANTRPASRKGRSRMLKMSQVGTSITSWAIKMDDPMWARPKMTKNMNETLAME